MMGSWGVTCAPQVWLLLSLSNPGGVTGREVQGPIRLWRTPLDTGGAEESAGILEVQGTITTWKCVAGFWRC